eukprot:TRINITY_DN11422_c2_g1_i1.p1 TRINITY_DN11422_c2_g1~~TRINITY_DN11422_c2_g1_i1.p1  ORF type:complete len:746 (+),score=134.29 TRINITY_DN11422_c2_g1_i1:41-2239(+)
MSMQAQDTPSAYKSIDMGVLSDSGEGEPTFEGKTAKKACVEGRVEILCAIIVKAKDVVNARDEMGDSLMHHAAGAAQEECIQFLLDHGAQVNARNDRDETPLMHAARNGHTVACTLLINNGSDIALADRDGKTALLHSLRWPITLHCLLRSDATKQHLEPSVLHFAAANDFYFSVLYCLEQLNIDVNTQDENGNTALHHACLQNHKSVAGMLASKGCDADIRNNAGETCLQVKNLESGVAKAVRTRNGSIDGSNVKVLRGTVNRCVATAACILPNGFLIAASMLPPVLGFAALVANLAMVAVITQRAAHKRTPDPGLAGWYAGGLVSGSGVVVYGLFPHIDYPILEPFWIVVTFLMMLSYFRAFLGDPGIVESTEQHRAELYASVSQAGAIDKNVFCPTSFVKKPYRSKFCSTTLRPVHRFDHYCVWTCNAIGGGNVRYFFGFAVLQCISQFLTSFFTYRYFTSHHLYPTAWQWTTPCVWFDFFFHPDLTLLTFYLVFYNFAVMLFIVSVFATQFIYISRNITSNEVWFTERYPWCLKLGTRSYTLYDNGFLSNWKDFFFGNLVGYTRSSPNMSTHLSTKVAQWNSWKARRAQKFNQQVADMPAGHPSLPKEIASSSMTTDVSSGLMIPTALQQHFLSMPIEARKELAHVQKEQLTSLGLLSASGELHPPTAEQEQAIVASLQQRMKQHKNQQPPADRKRYTSPPGSPSGASPAYTRDVLRGRSQQGTLATE